VFTTKAIPQLWRPLTAFLITKPKFAILLDPYFCYQYGSGLERESSRFTQPGDFFTYTAFCASIIVVSSYVSFALCFATCGLHRLHVCNVHQFRITSKYLPAQPTILAEAVPGIEEEYPCTSRSSVIRIIQKGLVWCCERGGIAIIDSFCGLTIPLGGFGSLHTISLQT
jgi:Derlin-2/3